MPSEREELSLDGLRAAWRGASPPPLAEGIEECDPETRAVVSWMRSALDGLEVPPAPVHLARAVRRGRRPFPLPLAAAASALVAAGLWLWLHAGVAAPHPDGRTEVAEHQESGSSHPGAGTGLPDEPVVAALEPDRIELRSGPVRLVLLQPANGR